MARGKFQTLTEQMFYILLCLRQERCGADVMAWVAEATAAGWRWARGRCTTCWSSFCRLVHPGDEGGGPEAELCAHPHWAGSLEAEARRLRQLTADYERLMESEGGAP